MATLTQKTQYDTWYTQLNQVRAKHGRPNIAVSTVNINTPNLSSQMSTLQSSVNTVKTTTDVHVTNASIDTTIPNIAKGNKVLLSTKTKIDSIISQMLAICHHYSADYNPHYSSCDGDEGDYGSNYRSCDTDDRSHQSGRMHGDDGVCDYSN